MKPRHVLGLSASAALLLAGCGSGAATGGSAASSTTTKPGVIAAFYPLEYAAQRIGGTHVSVTNLTKPGAEPHDLELTPRDAAAVSNAQLVVYLRGFQPSLDKALDGVDPGRVMDVTTSGQVSLKHRSPLGEAQEGHADEHEHADEAHAHAAEAGTSDPHFWLDPMRYGKVVDLVANRLGELDPSHKDDYRRNAEALRQELTGLDAEFRQGLAKCRSKELVTSHAAFGYLADRYGLTQVSIAGLTPEAEPDPAALAAVSDYAKEHKVRTIYAETLVSPAVAQTIARETGATTAVLDPLEGLTDSSGDANYLSVMRANLATLKQGQGCS